VKDILSSRQVLSYPNFDHPFCVATDASDDGLGAVLYQEYDGKTQLIKFASAALTDDEENTVVRQYVKFSARSISDSEKGYSATKRELAAIILALQSYHYYLWGRKFTLYTDHKALTFFLTQKKINPMLTNWFETLMEYDFDIVHRPGVRNVLPDALSRFYPKKDFDPNPLVAFRSLEVLYPTHDECTILEDVQERKRILQEAHALGHFGAKAMVKHIHTTHRVTWSRLHQDAHEVVRQCIPCQRYNIGRHGFHPLKSLQASWPWDHLCIDLKDMPLSRSGNLAYLLVVDVFTRFVFIRPMKGKTAQLVAEQLYQLFCDFGFPKILQSDNGPEFIADIFKELSKIAKIDQRFISAYHHRANGLAERNIRTTSDVVYKLLEGRTDLWDLYAPAAQLYVNLKISEVTGSAPFSLMYCRPFAGFTDFRTTSESHMTPEDLQTRLEFITSVVYPAVRQKATKAAKKRAQTFAKNYNIVTDPYPPGALVMVRDELRSDKVSPRYEAPLKFSDFLKAVHTLLKDKMVQYTVAPPVYLNLFPRQ
jgi:transposase InsO family protein